MNRLLRYFPLIFIIVLAVTIFSSCKDLYNADQELDINESKLYGDWYEYRSTAMGLYGLQQKLAEQLLILGELRGDLLTVTKNADADMIEINNFSVSKTNKYASPTNFFKLIAACNSFIRNLKIKHPEVENPSSPVSNFDKLYGEAICMRAWAYFNAARIYGKVPFIHETLTSYDEIVNYVNSPGEYKDDYYIVYNKDGFHNDTIVKDTILTKKYYDLPMVIDVFTNQIETKVKAVGVDYALDNNDNTWEVTTWHPYSMIALLGHMYLTRGNLQKAERYFREIIVNNTTGQTSARYELNKRFSYTSWKNIFTSIDNTEHIYTIWFNKKYFQQNQFQDFFVNKYMMKPTKIAISNWEQCRRGQVIDRSNPDPSKHQMTFVGIPGDFYRGNLFSYACIRGGNIQDTVGFYQYFEMLRRKSNLDFRGASAIMDGCDTLVAKYVDGTKTEFDKDANYIIYRAAGIHLYLSEIYTYYREGGNPTKGIYAYGLINNGAYNGYGISDATRTQLGVRGRVGLGSGDDGITSTSIVYIHDPNTNKIIGYTDYSEDIAGKQLYTEDMIIRERALELAFEGERFYDLMRVAKRRGDPSYLAKMVSAKYPDGQKQTIYNYLLDENNWYIHYFDE